MISLSKNTDQVVVALTAYDVEPYDIKNAKEYDPTRPLADRMPGGVGIHLVKKFIDEIDYDYKNGKSIITLVKYLEKSHVRDNDE